MTKLIIHIGTFKTGTTALQKYLAGRRERLLSESGLIFPRAGEIPAGGHHNLVYEVTGSWKHVPDRGGFKELEREILEGSPKAVLVSAENLSSYAVGNPVVAPRFGEFARHMGMPVQVVCYVRPQWEYIDSYYSQGVKSGYTTCSFQSFVNSALGEAIYDYEQVVAPWESVAERIMVRPYPGRELIPDMCRVLGISEPIDSGVGVNRSRNERFGAKRLEFMRRMGAALERSGAPFKKRIPIAHRLRDAVMEADIDDVKFSGLDTETAKKICEHFRAGNRRLSDRFGMGEAWYALPAEEFASTSFDMDAATDSDVRVFEDTVAKVLLMDV